MATWCLEASRALLSKGFQVILAVKPGLEYMAPEGVQLLVIDAFKEERATLSQKLGRGVQDVLSPLWPPKNSRAGNRILNLAFQNFRTIDVVLWNQSNLLSSLSSPPQWVVGWAYPDSLAGYLSKLKTPSTVNIIKRFYDQLYWYTTDNYAYRNAKGVLAVTRALEGSLRNKKIDCIYAPPGTASFPVDSFAENRLPHLLIVARWLDEPRKKVTWMIEALSGISNDKYQLSLIGEYSSALEDIVKAMDGKARFTGVVDRNQLIKELSGGDVLLFGSALDDWGYVQVEAMGCGLAVYAPRQLPSTEIIPDQRFLYEPGNKRSFADKLQEILSDPEGLLESRKQSCLRYQAEFSSEAFAARLLKIGNG